MEKTIKERMCIIAERHGLKDYEFEQIVGFANGVLRRYESEVKGSIIGNFIRKFPDVSPDWLILGTGDMLRTAEASNPYEQMAEPVQPYGKRSSKSADSITLPMSVYQVLLDQLKKKDDQIAEKDKQLENCAAQIATYMSALNQ